MKIREQIVPTLIGFGTFVALVSFVYIASTRTTTSFENALLQIISLALGIGASYYFGRRSAREAAKEIIRPHVRSALRRLDSLYDSLSRAAEVIESAQQPDVHEDYQVTLARLEEIVTGQLISADDAMEDWKDIFPDDVLDDWAEDLLENGLDNQGYILMDNAKWADLKAQNDDTTEAKQ